MLGINSSLKVVVCENAEQAIKQGHDYTADQFKPVEIERIVVVRDGTESHRSTVDIVFKDKDGNQFVTMLTGALLKSIPC